VKTNANLNTAVPLAPAGVPPLPRILVVDDNESIRTFLTHFFKLEGLEVEIIACPQAALERFRTAPREFSMLLTDCEMPGMTGLELAKRIRAARADLPMILFSTSVTVLGPAQFLSAGFSAALPKPVPLDRLRTTIRDVLATADPKP
jgi:CheY-like chemotaxis protein